MEVHEERIVEKSSIFKPLLGIVVLVLLVALVFWLRPTETSIPTPIPLATEWRTYSNADLGISFQYPPEWGEVSESILVREENVKNPWTTWAGRFSNNFNVSLQADTLDSEGSFLGYTFECPKPKEIHEDVFGPGQLLSGIGYCRLFTNDVQYLYEDISIADGGQNGNLPNRDPIVLNLFQTARVKLNTTYKGFEMDQYFYDNINEVDAVEYLKAIQNRTADPAILDKIDTFEKVMLSLVVQ